MPGMFDEWDSWETDPPYFPSAGLSDDTVIELWRPWEEDVPMSRIALRDVPDFIDCCGLWWRRCD
jgi:hypothetical protein